MMRVHRLGRSLLSLLLVATVAAPAVADAAKLRIGYQKGGTLIILKAHGTVEKRLALQGVAVEWVEFAAGPVLLEALGAGSIDFGMTGEAPPIFAQAAGNPLRYVGVEPSGPAGEAILVAKDSPITSLAGLRGKRVALNKGSNVHYFLLQALAKAGLKLNDVQPTYLAPADARAAFERGSVDAWVIWDPYLAAAQQATAARALADGTGLVENYIFYFASRNFAAAHPNLVRAVLDEIAVVDAWAPTHQHEIAELLAVQTGLPPSVLEVALSHLSYGVGPLDDPVIANQQRIADAFREIGLLPKPITVRDAVWSPQS
jgi:sulfonate transport system substrate-binding protein